MAEYINRDEFIKSQCHSCDGYCDVIECDCLNCKHKCRCDTIADLLDYPAADVRPVVLCRDCQYFENDCGWCGYFDIGMNVNDFCSHGKREES